MKYLKTFEGTFGDYFFRTKKVKSFANQLCEFINSHIDFTIGRGSVPDFLDPFTVIKLDGTSSNIIAIVSIPSYTSAVNFDLTLKNIKVKIPPANYGKTEQFQNIYIFLTAIFSQFSEKTEERLYEIYEIDISELPKILNEITQENFELYTATSKYNL